MQLLVIQFYYKQLHFKYSCVQETELFYFFYIYPQRSYKLSYVVTEEKQ